MTHQDKRPERECRRKEVDSKHDLELCGLVLLEQGRLVGACETTKPEFAKTAMGFSVSMRSR
jgi:hypothetical protein